MWWRERLNESKFNLAKGNCPNSWRKITSPVAACRSPNDNAGCFLAYFNSHDVPYTKVCGKVIGMQKGTPAPGDKFPSLDEPYLDGISLTYGNPREYIWSFAGSPSEINEYNSCLVPNIAEFFLQPFICITTVNQRPTVHLVQQSILQMTCCGTVKVVVYRIPAVWTLVCHGSSISYQYVASTGDIEMRICKGTELYVQ